LCNGKKRSRPQHGRSIRQTLLALPIEGKALPFLWNIRLGGSVYPPIRPHTACFVSLTKISARLPNVWNKGTNPFGCGIAVWFQITVIFVALSTKYAIRRLNYPPGRTGASVLTYGAKQLTETDHGKEILIWAFPCCFSLGMR
jgi:hypothetical protein